MVTSMAASALSVTLNFLVGCSRRPALINRFQFLHQLSRPGVSLQRSGGNCGGCNGKRNVDRAVNDTFLDVKRILATMSQADIDEFKQLADVKYLKIQYIDLRGQSVSITR